MPAPIDTPETAKRRAEYQATIAAQQRLHQDPEMMAWLRERLDELNKRYSR